MYMQLKEEELRRNRRVIRQNSGFCKSTPFTAIASGAISLKRTAADLKK